MFRAWQALQTALGYTFQNQELLAQALRHRSAGKPHNERLEFLGDAVLGFVISAELFAHQPRAKEGDLSRMRSALVNREILAGIAGMLQVSDSVELGPGERKTGGEQRQSILADTLEALIGAIYLDGGLVAVEQCIRQWFGDKVDGLATLQPMKDAKSALQEWLQSHQLPLPHYACRAEGLAHQQIFHVTCSVKGLDWVTEGTSSSRRKAEQLAAQQFLDLLNER